MNNKSILLMISISLNVAFLIALFMIFADQQNQPSPYKMGNTLLARIRGLIANHLSPNGLVG